MIQEPSSEPAGASQAGSADDASSGKASRGPRRAGTRGYPAALPKCAAMAVGSVPHTDPVEAVELIFRHTPEIPAWPQLPRRSFRENMYAQFAGGLPGMVVDDDAERLYVRRDAEDTEFLTFVERLESEDPAAFALEDEEASGLAPFLDALEGQDPPFVKGQVTGPISFSLGVAFEDRSALIYDDTIREAAARLLGAKASWQEALLAGTAPGALPLIMYDEPYLTQLGSGFISLPADTFELLSDALRAVGCLRGIHVCGGTDWERVSGLPLDALNFDAADHFDALVANADAVGEFVEQGGLLAWGAIPNDDRAKELTAEEVGRSLISGVEQLASHSGVDADLVLRSSFVSPACGTGTLPTSLAERCFALTHDTSSWIRARL